MKLAIMQPYFLPYIGYFQLIASVDVFVVYDNIKYTKKGWVNRNRLLQNHADAVFSLPLKKGPDALDVVDRELAAEFDRKKLINQFKGAYGKAPFFAPTFALVERIVGCTEANLFRYVHNSIVEICAHLGLHTDIRVSSGIPIDHNLKAQAKVIAICRAVGADTYINPLGGRELYERADFAQQGVRLKFLRPQLHEYEQFGAEFVPWLSIVDVLMFNSIDAVVSCIMPKYELI